VIEVDAIREKISWTDYTECSMVGLRKLASRKRGNVAVTNMCYSRAVIMLGVYAFPLQLVNNSTKQAGSE